MYKIKEREDHWKVKFEVFRFSITYRVSKELCPNRVKLQKYIEETLANDFAKRHALEFEPYLSPKETLILIVSMCAGAALLMFLAYCWAVYWW